MNTRPLTFSQRHGYAPLPEPVQLNELDKRTRTDIWNALHAWLFADRPDPYNLMDIWVSHYGYRTDKYEDYRISPTVEETVFNGAWHEILSLLEFIASTTPDDDQRLIELLNAILRYNRVGYRIVGSEVVPITDDTELDAIRETVAQPAGSPARQHMEKALALYADRDNPQYANSIKESISAVESAARDLAGQPSATLGTALDTITKQGTIHPALLKGWKAIYGFTSDSGGIRHADQPGSVPASPELAQYFLITCSAMVNYLTSLKSTTP
ncbi:AbiJ-NTD4 domain-containing protein [Mycobacterium asiaticum]|uniref:AbiJ-NTD4 domain-containing protein n=1 Tax=Mycobacterium asiaticum TaxID=1790 RepID=UPI0007EFC5D8|nr:hypothetical protein [Mycobacterium asiaticum]OBJ58965.1 hypothetical protein A9W94_15865 [Mycobacterium asiaticum]